MGSHDRAWRELHESTSSHAKAVQQSAAWADENQVTGIEGRDHREVRADAEALLAHLQNGGRWGIGPFRTAVVKKALYLADTVRLGGRPCDAPTALRGLIEWLTLQERLLELRRRWMPHYRVRAASVSSQAAEFLDLCEPLSVALDFHRQVEELRPLIQAVPGAVEPAWHDVLSLRNLVGCLKAVASQERLRSTQAPLGELRATLQALTLKPNPAPAILALASAVDTRSVDEYRTAYERIEGQHQIIRRIVRRDELFGQLQGGCSLLASAVAASAQSEQWHIRSPRFQAAWNWRRARRWLGRLSDAHAEQQLHLRLEAARTASRRRLSELASLKAWQHCFARMTEHERQHLIAWSKAVRAIGKGTGKYAPVHRRNAREHLNECRTAIPAWVMPLYRVAETIRPVRDAPGPEKPREFLTTAPEEESYAENSCCSRRSCGPTGWTTRATSLNAR